MYCMQLFVSAHLKTTLKHQQQMESNEPQNGD